jgi:hypothetical protein
VVKRIEACLSPSFAFNLSLSFNHDTLEIINKCFPRRNKKSCSLIWKSSTTRYGFIWKCLSLLLLLITNQVSFYFF